MRKNDRPSSKELVQAMKIIKNFCNDQTMDCDATKCPFYSTKGTNCILSNGAPLEWEVNKDVLRVYKRREDELNKRREAKKK